METSESPALAATSNGAQECSADRLNNLKSNPNPSPTQAVDREFLLATLRAASANLRTWLCEIDAVGVALKSGLVTTETAVERLSELGLIDYLPAPERVPS